MNYEDIDNKINEIYNGTRDFLQFNQSAHAGVCSAGPLLIGALLVCDKARESICSGSDAHGSETPGSSNWEIDEAQESALQQWAEGKSVWIPQAEEWVSLCALIVS